jgi:hypothetical protein
MANFHESFSADEEVKGSSDRAFGLTVGGILLLLGLVPVLWRGHLSTVGTVLVVIGGALVAAAALRPGSLATLNRLWTKLGLLLFRIVNPIVMFLIFALTVVPISLILRLVGKDLLRLRTDAAARSYWIVRDPPGPEPATMKQQF